MNSHINEIIENTAPSPSPEKPTEFIPDDFVEKKSIQVDMSTMLGDIFREINSLTEKRSDEESDGEETDGEETDGEESDEESEEESDGDANEDYKFNPRWLAINKLLDSHLELTRTVRKMITDEE